MNSDPITDMLTRIRNAYLVKKTEVVLPHSKFKQSLATILQNQGWIASAEIAEQDGMKMLRLQLKYGAEGRPAIEGVQRVSKPGQRIYFGQRELRRGRALGMSIVSTSRGLMTDRQARKEKIGGEVICQIW